MDKTLSSVRAREPYSIEQIMGAVTPVLAALSGGPVDPADARAIASLLSADVNSPTTGIAPGQNLLLNADFIRRVAERKGTVPGGDSDLARKQIADALKTANVSSSAFAAALGKAGFASAGLFAKGAEPSDDTKSSGRFKDINGGTSEGSGYSWLTAANKNIAGFSQAEVASTANFLKGMGLTQDEVNADTKHVIHLSKYRKEIGDFIKRKKDIERRRARGEDVSEEERRLEEDKKRARDRMTPEERRHFDQIQSIQTSNADFRKTHGNDYARSSTDEQRAKLTVADNNKAEVALSARQIEVDKVAKRQTQAAAIADADDVFGAAPPATPVKAEDVKPSVKTADAAIATTPEKPTVVATKTAKAPSLSA